MINRKDLVNLMESGSYEIDAIMQLITNEQEKFTRLVDAAVRCRQQYTQKQLDKLDYEPVKSLLIAAEEFVPPSLADRLREFARHVPVGSRLAEYNQITKEVRELENEIT
jgi:hypothetical protein